MIPSQFTQFCRVGGGDSLPTGYGVGIFRHFMPIPDAISSKVLTGNTAAFKFTDKNGAARYLVGIEYGGKVENFFVSYPFTAEGEVLPAVQRHLDTLSPSDQEKYWRGTLSDITLIAVCCGLAATDEAEAVEPGEAMLAFIHESNGFDLTWCLGQEIGVAWLGYQEGSNEPAATAFFKTRPAAKSQIYPQSLGKVSGNLSDAIMTPAAALALAADGKVPVDPRRAIWAEVEAGPGASAAGRGRPGGGGQASGGQAGSSGAEEREPPAPPPAEESAAPAAPPSRPRRPGQR